MHQIRFQLHGLHPGPRLGSSNTAALIQTLRDLRGHTSKGREGMGREEKRGSRGQNRGKRKVGERTSPLAIQLWKHQVALPAYLQRQLQSAQRAAALLLASTLRPHHYALAILHWLRVLQRSDYKVAVMAFRALNGQCSPYT